MPIRLRWLYLSVGIALASGCTLMAESGDDADSASLPTGVTLLESDRNECAGAVAIDEDSIAGRRGENPLVQPGQNAVFDIDVPENDAVEIAWICVGVADADEETVECPDQTSHIRITRALTEDDFLLECYGDRVVG